MVFATGKLENKICTMSFEYSVTSSSLCSSARRTLRHTLTSVKTTTWKMESWNKVRNHRSFYFHQCLTFATLSLSSFHSSDTQCHPPCIPSSLPFHSQFFRFLRIGSTIQGQYKRLSELISQVCKVMQNLFFQLPSLRKCHGRM